MPEGPFCQIRAHIYIYIYIYIDLDTRKPVFRFANNKGADKSQSVHPRRLISAFVICFFECPESENCDSLLLLVSEAEETQI